MSVMAQKIKGASFQADAYPRLKDLMQGLCEIVSAALDASFGQEDVELHAEGERIDYFDAGQGVVYCFSSIEASEHAALIFPASFLKALSEASLGGEFELDENATAPSTLEQSLGEPFATEALAAASSLLISPSAEFQKVNFRFTGVESDPKALGKMFSGQSFFKVSVSLREDGKAGANVVSCLFPYEFLEQQGLLKQGAEKSAANVNAEWRTKMLKHIHAAEIEIDVIMDQYMTPVSELANLEIGQVVPLEGDAHKTLSLYLNTKDGPVPLGKGRLGTFKKKKAVKLTTKLDPPPPAS